MSNSRGDWVEYDYDAVRKAIYDNADIRDSGFADAVIENARNVFEECRAEIISVLSTALDQRDDSFLKRLERDAEEMKILYSSHFVEIYPPSGSFMTNDLVAVGQGLQTPPPIAVLADSIAIRHSAKACEELSKLASRAASHLAKRERYAQRNREIGINVFIGHGRSLIWKDLKDFIEARLALPSDEFNRMPVAGFTNIARLSQMLDDAAIALLVMTAEDEQADGKVRARMNIIHEAGLFQGRLGFARAIILVEDGCEEFSNLQGLGQIRFPKGNIKAAFEEIRQVLEREGLVTPSA